MKNNARFLPNLSSDEIAHKQLEGLKWTVKSCFSRWSPEFDRSRLEEAQDIGLRSHWTLSVPKI